MNNNPFTTKSRGATSCIHFLSVIAIITLSACAQKEVKQEQFSGFLGDYSDFEEIQSGDGTLMIGWAAPDLSISGKYDAIIIDPVVVHPPRNTFDRADEEAVAETLAYMNKRQREELGKRFKVVNEPGPGVLRYRSALTTVDVGFKPLEWYQYMPVTAAVTVVSEATGLRDEAVQVIAEAELLDSRTGKRLAAGARLGSESVKDGTPVELTDLKPILNQWAISAGAWFDRY
jgi:hypothetical protein